MRKNFTYLPNELSKRNACIHLLILSLSPPSGPEILTDVRPVLLDRQVFICAFSVHIEKLCSDFHRCRSNSVSNTNNSSNRNNSVSGNGNSIYEALVAKYY